MYFAGIYKRSLQPNPNIPPPQEHGWKIEGNDLVIDWMTLPPAPDTVMQLAYCLGGCKKSSCTDVNKCTCLENNVPCTDLCSCATKICSNVAGQVELGEEEEGDSDDVESSDAED